MQSSSHHTLDYTLIGTAILLLSCVFASKASTRLGIPALLFFLGLGMLAGSEGIGGIDFEDYHLAGSIGSIALILILFAGGLETHWKSIKPILGAGLSLATIGVAVTAALVGLFSHLVLGMPWQLSILLGSVVSSTDAAAIFGALRSRGLRLKGNLTALIEFESGSNDPMAVFLTIGITSIILVPNSSISALVPQLIVQMIVGALGGLLIGFFGKIIINRVRLESDGLYPVLTIGIALLSYSAPQLLGGNGYLAAYVAGVTLGSSHFVHRVSLIQFNDALSWLMQIVMFLCLGLLVFPSHLVPQAHLSIITALFLVFVARPIAVFASLLPFKYSIRENLFLAWAGLRGAVPIILATIPVTMGVKGSELIFDQVFFMVLVSVLCQGVSIGWVAKKLGVVNAEDTHITERKISTTMLEVKVPKDSPVVGKRVFELELPEGVLLILLTRGTEAFIPRGSTVIEASDLLHISDQGVDVDKLKNFFRTGAALPVS